MSLNCINYINPTQNIPLEWEIQFNFFMRLIYSYFENIDR